jgi:hypothetical protein
VYGNEHGHGDYHGIGISAIIGMSGNFEALEKVQNIGTMSTSATTENYRHERDDGEVYGNKHDQEYYHDNGQGRPLGQLGLLNMMTLV